MNHVYRTTRIFVSARISSRLAKPGKKRNQSYVRVNSDPAVKEQKSFSSHSYNLHSTGDCRRLTRKTNPDRYPLSHINTLKSNLNNTTLLAKVNLVKAHIRIHLLQLVL